MDVMELRRTLMAAGGDVMPKAIFGTFTPESDQTTVTIPEAIGKSSIFVYPLFDISTEEIANRVHWGDIIVSGRCILHGSTNTSKTSYTFSGALQSATGGVNNPATFDSISGTLHIGPGVGANYGGYYIAGKQYGYIAW